MKRVQTNLRHHSVLILLDLGGPTPRGGFPCRGQEANEISCQLEPVILLMGGWMEGGEEGGSHHSLHPPFLLFLHPDLVPEAELHLVLQSDSGDEEGTSGTCRPGYRSFLSYKPHQST